MNRREFTASLATLEFLPALPAAPPAVAIAAPAVPAGVYAWAHLIARAQTKCSPAMLARQLLNTLVSDGVLKAPIVAGAANAAQPINATGTDHGLAKRLRSSLKQTLDPNQTSAQEQVQSTYTPLANEDEPCLGCENPQIEDMTDASTDQFVQESPERG